MRLEKVVVVESVGMLKLLPFTSLKVHWMFPVFTSGVASKMMKDRVTLISSIPTILPWSVCTVGGTEGGGGVELTCDSSSAVYNVVSWCAET